MTLANQEINTLVHKITSLTALGSGKMVSLQSVLMPDLAFLHTPKFWAWLFCILWYVF